MRKSISRALRLLPLALLLGLPAAGGARDGGDLRRDAVVEAVEKARPSVVNINAEEGMVRRNPFFGYGESPFDQFFRNFFESAPLRQRSARSLGSGVIIDPEGLILTNEHVVARASRIRVKLADERTLDARIVGSDPDHDLAILKVESPEALPAIAIGGSSDLMIGEKVIAIGNPFGLSHSVTTGVVSATRRSIRTGGGRVYYDFIQTDAAINPGNSGGPLLNIEGALVGINTAIYSEGDGIGFAIPGDIARRVVEDLVRYGEFQPVWLGIAVRDLRRAGWRDGDAPPGVEVVGLLSGGAAEKAGLKRGDIVLSVGGEPVSSVGEYGYRLGTSSHGALVPVQVRRGKRIADFIVRAETPDGKTLRRMGWEWFGLEVGEDRRGVLVSRVRRGSTAAATGLERGDRIHEVEGNRVLTLEDYQKAILSAGQRGRGLFLVVRGRWGYHITLKVSPQSRP